MSGRRWIGKGILAVVLGASLVNAPRLYAQAKEPRPENDGSGGIFSAKDEMARYYIPPEQEASYRYPDPYQVLTPPGYHIEVFANELDFPSDITFADDGTYYIAESGFHGYGDDPIVTPEPQIIQIRPDGTKLTVYEDTVPLASIRNTKNPEDIPEGIIPPITGITWHDGKIYVSHRTRISVLDPKDENPETRFRTIVRGLPAWGVHVNAKVVFDRDGKMVFFVPPQSDAGVYDETQAIIGLIDQKLDAHDVPGEDVTLSGENFHVPLKKANDYGRFTRTPDEETDIAVENPISHVAYEHIRKIFEPENGKNVETGAFSPLWTKTEAGQVIKGQTICNGAFFRCDPDGSNLERIAWGFGPSDGYRVDEQGRLFCTQTGAQATKPRAPWFDYGSVYEVQAGPWYGWPDFFSGLPITDPRFQSPEAKSRKFLLSDDTRRKLLGDRGLPPQPIARLTPQSFPHGMVLGRPEFGLGPHEALVAEMGPLSPLFKGPVGIFTASMAEERVRIREALPAGIPADVDLNWPGFKIQKVNLDTGEVSDFVVNRLPGPSTAWRGRGLERPMQLEWGRDGNLYIVDLGVITSKLIEDGETLNASVHTGVIWRVRRFQPPMPSGPVVKGTVSSQVSVP